jgi:hypothetical protein
VHAKYNLQSGLWYDISWALVGFLRQEHKGHIPSGCVFFGKH